MSEIPLSIKLLGSAAFMLLANACASVTPAPAPTRIAPTSAPEQCMAVIGTGDTLIGFADELIRPTSFGNQYPPGSIDETTAKAILGSRANATINGTPVANVSASTLPINGVLKYDETDRYNISQHDGKYSKGCNIHNLQAKWDPTPVPTEDSPLAVVKNLESRTAGGDQTDDFTDAEGNRHETIWDTDNPVLFNKNVYGGGAYAKRWSAVDRAIATIQAKNNGAFDCKVTLPKGAETGQYTAVAATDYTPGGEPKYKELIGGGELDLWNQQHPNKQEYSVTAKGVKKCGVIFESTAPLSQYATIQVVLP